MTNILRTLGLVTSYLLAGAAVGSAQDTPTYANVQVVSVDAASRIVVLRSSKGVNESFVLDDLLAGTGGVRAGDRVMVTLRGGPGRKRISAMSVVTVSAVPANMAVTSPPARRPVIADAALKGGAQVEMRDRFATQVKTLSEDARSIDAAWSSFVTSCNVKQPANTGGGRDWFGLWDTRVQADYSSGFCRDLFNQIISSGEGIKKAMAAAEDVALKTLSVGEIRDIRTLHAMNWDGWALPAPPKREP